MSVWDDIYLSDKWGGGSGPGSKAETTKEYRVFLEAFVRHNDISYVLDVGCGDGEVAGLIDWCVADYFGIDASYEAICLARKNNPKMPSRSFDASSHPEFHRPLHGLENRSLAIVKDVFQHLPFQNIRDIIHSLKGFKHVLVTNDIPQPGEQPDCNEGDWRPVDITLPPLNYKAGEVLVFQSAPLMKKTVHIINF